ncbi:MAG: hypothetical protein ACE364_07535 [Chlorobiota bacterium]
MRFLLLIFAFSSFAFANPKTNLEIVLDQIDSLAVKAQQKIYNKKIRPLTEYTTLKDKLESSLRNLDTAIVITNEDNYGTSVNLDSISIVYEEESGTRQINTSLYIITLNDDHIVEYRVSTSYQDTIDLDLTSELEDESFEFTKGVRIEESSFWDDVWEPAAYVGGAAVIIYLLFTVRSG